MMAPVGLAAAADGALAALQAIADTPWLAGLKGSTLLGERSRLAGLTRQGAISPGGGARLLHAADGVVAVSLVRPSDWERIPAWTGGPDVADWDGVARLLQNIPVAECVEQGRLLGLAVADASPPWSDDRRWYETFAVGARRSAAAKSAPRVVDLSSLWAGPLCADLLGRAGAEVIKVESVRRPDGARLGDRAFYDRLNGGKASVVLDFVDAADRQSLVSLLMSADIVIEGSRPRALRQMGIRAEELVRDKPGLTWIALSGYGRNDPQGQWIGFGDDAAVAAGLSRLMYATYGEWLFCGDAIADPLTGMHAALLAWSSWLKGGGVAHSISLHGVVAAVIAAEGPFDAASRQGRAREWLRRASRDGDELYDLPRARGPAAALGADNAMILSRLWSC